MFLSYASYYLPFRVYLSFNTNLSHIICIGAKYGGYGSFLSMYQRSPACKSPPQAQNQVVRVPLKAFRGQM